MDEEQHAASRLGRDIIFLGCHERETVKENMRDVQPCRKGVSEKAGTLID